MAYEKSCAAKQCSPSAMRIAPATPRENVQGSIESLHKDVSALSEELGQLLSRLAPIVNPLPESAATARGGIERSSPPLRSQINAVRETISVMRERLRLTSEGLDL